MTDNRKEELIELLTNEDFKRWILEPTYERDLFWRKWMENNPDKNELVNAAREFIRSANYKKPVLAPEIKDEVLSNIILNKFSDRKSGIVETGRKERSYVPVYLYKIAAAVLILVTFFGLVWWSSFKQGEQESVQKLTLTKKENPEGRKSVIMLSDGSMVTLNSASELVYDSDYGKTSRTVRIKGEAFFEVKRDIHKPFKVITGDIVTSVLGTSFNVRAFESENKLRISLKTGKVKVVHLMEESDAEHMLNPGEGFVIQKANGEMEKVKVDPLIEYGWKDGILVFKDSNLTEVVQSLERWYGVNIKVTGHPAKLWRVDGKFDNETLEQVLQGLSFTYDLDFRISGKNVELKFE